MQRSRYITAVLLIVRACQPAASSRAPAAPPRVGLHASLNSHAVVFGDVTPHHAHLRHADDDSSGSSSDIKVQLSIVGWGALTSAQADADVSILVPHVACAPQPVPYLLKLPAAAARLPYATLEATQSSSSGGGTTVHWQQNLTASGIWGAGRIDIDLDAAGTVQHPQQQRPVPAHHAQDTNSPGHADVTAAAQTQPQLLPSLLWTDWRHASPATVLLMLRSRCTMYADDSISCRAQRDELLAAAAMLLLGQVLLLCLLTRRQKRPLLRRQSSQPSHHTNIQRLSSEALTLELDLDQTPERTTPSSHQQVMQHLTPSGSIACVPRPSSLWQRSRQPSGVPPVEQGPSSQSHYDWDDADNAVESSPSMERGHKWKRQGRRLMRDSTALFFDAEPEAGGPPPHDSPSALQHVSEA